MKRLILLLFAITLVVSEGEEGRAAAITFTDTTKFHDYGTDPNVDLDSYGGSYVNKLEYMTDWVSWTHHFTFDPAAQDVLGATVTLSFTDNDQDYYWCIFPVDHEWALGWAEDWTWDFGEVDTGQYAYSVSGSYVVDGEFSITVASVWGDFYIDQSDLEITYNPVPEPATMLLMGIGLVGVAGLGRKKLFGKK